MPDRAHDALMADFRITTLSEAEADEALVLARLDDPSIDTDVWRQTVLSQRGEHVVVARRAAGPLVGLARYRLDGDGALHPVFHLLQLIAVDVLRPAYVASALMREMLWRAREHQCETFRVETPLPQGVEPMALALASGVCRLHSLF